MKQQVLKALANPPLLLFVPYNLAIGNFVFQFLIFMILYIGGMLTLGTFNSDGMEILNRYLNPLYFFISVIVVHLVLMRLSKRDGHLGQILIAKIRLYKSRIPRRLNG